MTDDLKLSEEQQRGVHEMVERTEHRNAEDPRVALRELGWMNVRDLHDAYVEQQAQLDTVRQALEAIKDHDNGGCECQSELADETLAQFRGGSS